MNTNRFHRPLSASMVGICLVSACATNPDGSVSIDEKTKAALMGAVAGCAVGAAVKGTKGCGVGAVVGAAAGFMIGWYFESKKIATGKQVNATYEQQNKAVAKGKAVPLPKTEIVPVKFENQVTTAPADSSGQKEVQVTSNTDLVGYGDKVPVVQQKYALYDEKNNLIEEKTEKIAVVDGAGRYQTKSKFKLPSDAKDKNYTVKTALVTDGKIYKESVYKVTLIGDQVTMIASLQP